MTNRPMCLGTVRDYRALRAAIDEVPSLVSARLTLDYQAIAVELNAHLPDGRMVSVFDVQRAMDLRPVPEPKIVARAAGRAICQSTYTVSKNPGGPKKPRTGTMTVAGKTVTVTQQ